jgi:hypothetical protein
MSWRHEHGSEYAVPEEVLSLVEEGKLFDWSYHNDTCPKFCTTDPSAAIGEKPGRALWVEHPDPERREDEVRYCVQNTVDGFCTSPILSTDDLSEALSVLFPEG